ncbi:glutaredoxin family protein [Paludisphaera soli]|uniref:glutaredoxin family protein n=1 Tax=Paludisphaera soli TaxID=2712865 RepID=UPI0013EC9FAB|nr:glutaredoxin family protein [Paludisphaera soli]
MPTLWDKLVDRNARMAPVTFTVYSRPGCTCCVKAVAVLKSFQDRYPMEIEVVDVDGSEELKARFGMEVPVVAVDGRVRFRGSVNPAMLERLLAAEAGGGNREGS